MKDDRYSRLIPNIDEQTVSSVISSVREKFGRGRKSESNQTYYHTGPHHDDILLGLLPHIHRLMRDESNSSLISVLTSGFTAVTNIFLIDSLSETTKFLDEGLI